MGFNGPHLNVDPGNGPHTEADPGGVGAEYHRTDVVKHPNNEWFSLSLLVRKECIPVGCVPTGRGRWWSCPGGGVVVVLSRGGGGPVRGGGGDVPFLPSLADHLPPPVTMWPIPWYIWCHLRPSWTEWVAHACENITFARFAMWAVIKMFSKVRKQIHQQIHRNVKNNSFQSFLVHNILSITEYKRSFSFLPKSNIRNKRTLRSEKNHEMYVFVPKTSGVWKWLILAK